MIHAFLLTAAVAAAVLAAPATAAAPPGDALVSRQDAGAGGAPADGPSDSPSMSADGRLIAFHSRGANLAPGDPEPPGELGPLDVFVHEPATGRTTHLSPAAAVGGAEVESYDPFLAAYGKHVAFIAGTRVVVADLPGGRLHRIGEVGRQAQIGTGAGPRLSRDGRVVAYTDGEDRSRLRVVDRRRGRSATPSRGLPGDVRDVAISANGRYVAWSMTRPARGGVAVTIHRHDRRTRRRIRVGRHRMGEYDGWRDYRVSLSADGRVVAYQAEVPDPRKRGDRFTAIRLADLRTGRRKLIAPRSPSNEGGRFAHGPVLAANGRLLAYDADDGIHVLDRRTGRTRVVRRGVGYPALAERGGRLAYVDILGGELIYAGRR